MMLLPQDQWGVVVKNYKELYTSNATYTAQLRALEKASNAKPDDPGMRFLLGFHYNYLGYPTQAARELEKVVQLCPRMSYRRSCWPRSAARRPRRNRPRQPHPQGASPRSDFPLDARCEEPRRRFAPGVFLCTNPAWDTPLRKMRRLLRQFPPNSAAKARGFSSSPVACFVSSFQGRVRPGANTRFRMNSPTWRLSV